MKNLTKKTTLHRGGWVFADTIIGLVLLVILLGGWTMTQSALGTFNQYQLARRHCLQAAEAQMDSLTATGRPIEQDQLQRLWPGVTVTIDRTAGQGDWAGLTLLKVSAGASSAGKPVKVELCRYVAPRKEG